MTAEVPDYCQVLEVAAADGTIKKLIFPKGLDLNRPKRPRTTFSKEQLMVLKREFDRNPYLIGKERKELAKRLDLTETQVKVWFQNRRTKYKRPLTFDEQLLDNEQKQREKNMVLAAKIKTPPNFNNNSVPLPLFQPLRNPFFEHSQSSSDHPNFQNKWQLFEPSFTKNGCF